MGTRRFDAAIQAVRRCGLVIAALPAALACGGEVTSHGAGVAQGGTGAGAGQATGGSGAGGPDAGEQDAEAPPLAVDLLPFDGGWAVCAGRSFSTEPKPVVVDLVVDVSSAMNLSAPGSSDTVWDITRTTLVSAVDSLPDSAWVGVQFFPNMVTGIFTNPQPHTACIDQANNVNVAPLGSPDSAQRVAIDHAFSAISLVAGEGTPTLDAYDQAVADLFDRSATLPSVQYIVLVTLGQPTYAASCVGDGLPPVDLRPLTDPIVNAIDSTLTAGVKTIVVGTPGSQQGADTGIDARPWLSEAARAGGTAPASCSDSGPNFCHLDLAGSQDPAGELGLALARIANTEVSCTYDLSPLQGSTARNALSVVYTAEDGSRYLVVLNRSSTCEFGWHWIAGSAQLEICGTTCDRIKHDPGATIDLFFGCIAPVLVT
jgi:hypothetical protein